MRGNRALRCAAAALFAFGVAAVIPAAGRDDRRTHPQPLSDGRDGDFGASELGDRVWRYGQGRDVGAGWRHLQPVLGDRYRVGVFHRIDSRNHVDGAARNLSPHTSYCYQILDGGTTVLTAPITFSTSPAPGDTSSFSFDVIGDTGYNGNSGSNPDQDRLYAQMATSGASFTLTAGDIAYPDGSQTNYGDLLSRGPNVSAIFGPNGWPVFGGSASAFPVLGNHGRSATFLQNWPTPDGVSTSGGVYSMVNYPGHAGANTASYPTAYYAFSVGQARFYVLDADWTDDNVGTSTLYGKDYLNHWTHGNAEYQWLKADLAAHPGGLKFAAFHFPLHSDNATEASDTALQGANSLEGLLASAGVDVVFNGHAHMYQRNAPAQGAMVSYVTGGGGVPEPTGGLGCSPEDLYSIGWSRPTTWVTVRHRAGSNITVPGVSLPARHRLRLERHRRAAERAWPELRCGDVSVPQHAGAGHDNAHADGRHIRLSGHPYSVIRLDDTTARLGVRLPKPAAFQHERDRPVGERDRCDAARLFDRGPAQRRRPSAP